MDKNNILNEINEIVGNYENSQIQIVKGLYYNQSETLRKIEFYWNSKYLNKQTDELGRIKPFHQISKFRVNVATRATDLDIKDIKITSDNPSERVRSMILNHELYNWMKEANLSKTLNEFGKNRAKYGGALIKNHIENGKLKIEIVEWKNTITDQVSIADGVIIETHYMSPSELSKKKDVWDNVPEAMKLATKTQNNNNSSSETSENKIPIYEIHGEFPQTMNPNIIENADESIYEQMSFIIAGSKDGKQYIMDFQEEKEMPYHFLAWDSVAGRGLGIGIVEDGFEAQMWTNDAIIAEKNAMDLAGKVYIQTTSKKLGNNILTDSDNGTVFDVEEGSQTNVLNLTPTALPMFQNLVEKWNTQYERATNTFEAVSGETMPSGTPLGSLAIQSAQSGSFFDYRREEAGIFWEEVIIKVVMPFLIKKINKQHILASDFSNDELEVIDSSFSTYHANEMAKNKILDGKIITQDEYNDYITALKELISTDKKRRYIDVPDNYFKDFEAKVSIDITGEKKNKQAILQSLFTVLTQITSNPTILADKNTLAIFNQMLEMSGLDFMPIPLQPQLAQASKGGTAQAPDIGGGAVAKQTESVLPAAQQK